MMKQGEDRLQIMSSFIEVFEVGQSDIYHIIMRFMYIEMEITLLS